MNENHAIWWRDEVVGYMENVQIDMWYHEGDWMPQQSEHTEEFIAWLSDIESLKVGGHDAFNANLNKWKWVGFGRNDPGWLVFIFEHNRIGLRVTVTSKPDGWEYVQTS